MAEVKLHLTTLNDDMFFKFITKEGKLFAKSIKFDGRLVASGEKMLEYYIDKVSDSSRFFVVKIQNPRTKKTLPIGIGFSDRENAMSLNASIDDHIKQVQREIEYEKMKSSKGTSAVKDDEDDLFADFSNLRGPSSGTGGGSNISNIAPPSVSNIAPPSAGAGTKKKKKKKKKGAKAKAKAEAKFGDDFDADFADFGNFESGNTSETKSSATSAGAGGGFSTEGWEASFESANNNTAEAKSQPPAATATTTSQATNDILGLFS
eukprot:CAMPEP_0170173568 /NCGR_PEP_ID=MMETSP0040_2-20121228/6861_1 /TAXON_ID=641309 /ORGANISM="Lotharella oceanica, Strain CCMP622" /LENGTH=262 /DNA_ID=CAMNT_0010414813 /DNA_START=45 /DNA_END=833 /DNA_ORIENTATION=-